MDEVKPVSGLDIEALLLKGGAGKDSQSQEKRRKIDSRIGTDDPAKDFKKLIDDEANSWKSGSTPFYLPYGSFHGNGTGN